MIILITCLRCARTKPRRARGLCDGCWRQLRRTGGLAAYPVHVGYRGPRDGVAAADRYEDYQFLLSTGRARNLTEAAAILGVKRATLARAVTRHRRRARRQALELAA